MWASEDRFIVGFGLHNATEGFIVAPLAAEGERPSWPALLWLGLLGGGPTFSARSSASTW